MSPAVTTLSTASSSASLSSIHTQDISIKPNPHPYAIKTTSTGILTRSNSTSENTQSSRHYYVPLSPTHARSPDAKFKSHRTSKSLNDPTPRPLPTPPDNTSPTRSAPVVGSLSSQRSKWSDADAHSSLNSVRLEDLPSNPKIWTPAQLSSYLTTALRVRSGEAMSLPPPVANDIANFVKESKINGRLFLRLSEPDLEAMGVNKLWQDALLSSSRDLRQNVLKGRIWGTAADDESFPFSSELYNSSSSSVDLPSSASLLIESDEKSTRGVQNTRRSRNGRVRGMVASFERSGSFSSDSSRPDIDISDATRSAEEEAVAPSTGDADYYDSQPSSASANSSPSKRPLPQPPLHPSLREFPEDEPTIEELLDSEGGVVALKEGSWGARAWEEIDMNAAITVKKALKIDLKMEADKSLNVIGESRSCGPADSSKRRDERRVVTAIFSPDVTGNVSTNMEQERMKEEIQSLRVKEEQLEERVGSTIGLLEVFSKRLEEVERKMLEMEEAEIQMKQDLFLKDRENEDLKAKLLVNENTLIKASPANKDTRKKKPLDSLDPQSMTALSQYVILVGLGVCAVVLKVVLKKVVGKSLKY